MQTKLPMRIILESPPPEVDFGLQKGSGSKYETVQVQQFTTHDLHFDYTINLKNPVEAQPDFSGVFVQGLRGKRFIYIDIGTAAGQYNTPWTRRLKIPLCGISKEMVDKVIGTPRSFLVARVAGTGKDGGPNCATGKLFEGWHMEG